MKTNSRFLFAILVLGLGIHISCSGDGNDGSSSGKDNNIANYRTVQIGTQTWMAENLNYDVKGSICNENDPANCQKYGRLYDWKTAKKVCPAGWHLPSEDEWTVLIDFVGGESIAGTKLKSITDDWIHNGDLGNGTDDFGFSALPGGGGRSNGKKFFRDGIGFWWSATEGINVESKKPCAYYIGMVSEDSGLERGCSQNDGGRLFSVRCVKD